MAKSSPFTRSGTVRPATGRSLQPLSHRHTFTADFGYLYPCFIQKAYPGDTYRIENTHFIRTIPLVTPALTRMRVYTRYYFVPFRILWRPWEKYIFGGQNGSFTATEPYIATESDGTTKFKYNDLGNHFGFPTDKTLKYNADDAKKSTHVSAFPFAAYQMIFKEFYRNQNVEVDMPNPENVSVSESDKELRTSYENFGLYPLRNGANHFITNRDEDENIAESTLPLNYLQAANWRLDYFTSLNPWQQRGEQAVVPVHSSGDLPVTMGEDSITTNVVSSNLSVIHPSGTSHSTAGQGIHFPATVSGNGASSTVRPLVVSLDENLGFFSLDDQRLAIQLQMMREKSARGGARYTEGLYAFFGTAPSDARLDRPEYIGGCVQDIGISEVVQMSDSDTSPLGKLAGKGVSGRTGWIGRYHCQEHGVIIGLMHIMPDVVYSQGLDREWNTSNRLDWHFPEFDGLSEQPVYNKELFVSDDDDYNAQVLGYGGRYNELRWRRDYVSGDFSDPSQEYYKPWLIQRRWTESNKPTLNLDLISGRDNVPHDIFTVTNPDLMKPFMVDSYFRVTGVRRLTRKAIPAKI